MAGKRTNERPGPDHVTSGPMRGLKKLQRWHKWTDRQADKQTDMATESAQLGGFNKSYLKSRLAAPVSNKKNLSYFIIPNYLPMQVLYASP